MGSQKKHMTIHKEDQTQHKQILHQEEEETEDRALVLKTTKVVEYLEPMMSFELLCKFPDNSAYDFDYSQSTIWSPLVPIRTPRNLSYDDDDEMMMGLELFGARNKKKKKKFITTTTASAFKLNLDFFKKQSMTKNMASDLSPTPRRRIKGACNPIINKGWAKALKAASKQFKRWKVGRDPNISHVMLPRFPNTYLLVGCCSDAVTHKYKGKTVMTEDERYESLRHCKWVDEVIPNAPWVINQEFLDNHNIDYVAHDSLPYADASGSANDVYEFVKAVGKFKETKRTDGISTSDIIMRIVKDYNQYVLRNLDRGYSRKELGVSYVKEKRLRVNRRLKDLQEKVKEQQEKIQIVAKNAGIHRNEWVDNVDRLVAGFLEMFEEGCHKMGTAIRDRIQERLMGQQFKDDKVVDGEEYYDDDDDGGGDDEQYFEEYFGVDELNPHNNGKDENKK